MNYILFNKKMNDTKSNISKKIYNENEEKNEKNISLNIKEIKSTNEVEKKIEEISIDQKIKNHLETHSDLENSKINESNCYKCNSKENKTELFSCNHLICIECLIKDLLINKFKKLENEKEITFSCICRIGKLKIDFDNLINLQKDFLKPKIPGKCKEHNKDGIKFCKICELWLCNECLNIHKVFNNNHELSNNEFNISHICNIHGDINKYYCNNCKIEICGNCLIKGEKHFEHKFFPLENFKDLINEIKQKIKFKNYESFNEMIKQIEDNLIKKKNEKCEIVNNKINEIINKLELIKENYNKEINEKFINLQKSIEVIKNSFYYYYQQLENEEQSFYSLDFLQKIEEIKNIEIIFSNFDELISCLNNIKLFEKKEYFLFQILNSENPYPFIYNKYETFKKQSKSQYIKNKEYKYELSLKNLGDCIYSIIKLDKNNTFALSIGKNIIIIKDYKTTNKKILSGHMKNITTLNLLKENILISGSEDKTIRIWNYEKEKCIQIITGNYEKIDTILILSEIKIAIGCFNIIRIFNLEKKKEEYNLIGHEKSINTIIKINDNIIASGSYDNTIKLYSLIEKNVKFTLFGHDSPIYCLLLLNNGKLISGSGSYDKSIKVWNLKEKNCEFTLLGHKREVRCLNELKNGFLISGSMDKSIRIWNVNKKICIQVLNFHSDVIFCICSFKDRILSGGRDQEIVVWKYC